jgi:tRNA threonylcarbamoyl adenosine modification protein YeaZ
MLILGVDTSSPATSLAIICGQELLAVHHEEHEHPPSDAVFGLLDDLLKKHGFSINDIDLFSTCAGPGSFTGLRIGVGLAKTFALALRKPVIGIDAVTVMASRAIATCPDRKDDFAVVVQGFKESTFLGRFAVANGRPRLQGELKVALGEDELLSWVGSEKNMFVDPNLRWEIDNATQIEFDEPVAVSVARLAWALVQEDKIPEFDAVQPLYLRAFNVGRKAKKPEDMR